MRTSKTGFALAFVVVVLVVGCVILFAVANQVGCLFVIATDVADCNCNNNKCQ